MIRFFRTFMVVTGILVIMLVALTIFAQYVIVASLDMKKMTVERMALLQNKKAVINDVPLLVIQNKVLGYKNIPFVPWSANDPKPPKADILIESYMSEGVRPDTKDPAIKCIDNECRWKEL